MKTQLCELALRGT